MKSRTIIIGDIHGCLAEAECLVNQLNTTAGTDRVILLGDLIDRGPSPVEAVRWARRNNFETILGNHEQKLAKWKLREAQEKETGRKNQMRPPAASRLAQWNQFTEEEIQWVRDLPRYIDLGRGWLAVHGGLLPGVPLKKHRDDDFTHIRWLDNLTHEPVQIGEELEQPKDSTHWSELWDGENHVVYGHHVFDDLQVHMCSYHGWHRVGIDTGCVFGGTLTAMILHEDGQIQFENIKSACAYSEHDR